MASQISANLDAIFARKRAAVWALCLYYAGLALAKFRQDQPDSTGGGSWMDRYKGLGMGRYWHNQTGVAAKTVFSDAFQDGDEMGFFLAHMVEYGVYLELANNRAHEALRPIIEDLYQEFRKALAEIYGDAA